MPSQHQTSAQSEKGWAGRQPESGGELPASLLPLTLTETPVPRDRSLLVSHAPAETDHAIVYLHGMCGNPRGADSWLDLANQRGTFIVVRANVKCPERPGYKWPTDVALIHSRIQRALEEVKSIRDGLMNVRPVTLVGYSQGAHRAERLAEAYPEYYPRVVMGGPPTPPEPERLKAAARVAILGGELENTDYMRNAAKALREAGIYSRFFVLPGAHHGSYGPKGHDVMAEVLAFVFD